ncbi:protein FAR1-RELATED SEQUENCE [Trifolium repens]|nr:protein FAR1-RELATED SEQUENCE [Trifolium repens]
MSTYSEATVHLDSDTEEEEEEEINSGNGADTNGDAEDIEFNSGNGVRTDRDTQGNGACSQQQKENSDDYKCISDLTDDDIRGMEFSTEGEAIAFYTMYAHLHGFAVRKDDVLRDRDKKIIVMRQLLCNKEGTSEGQERPTMRTGCKAKLRIVYDIIRKKYRVSVFNPTHNHDLTPEQFVHLIPNYRRLTEEDKQVVNGLHSQGVRTCHIMGFLMGQKGGHEGIGFIRKDLYNYTDHQARVRIEGGDTYATLSYFQDATSRFDYECFGDVVAFDTTYRKNRYGKPLVIFSGYNHHGETTIFAAALVCDETIETYKWVLNLFSKAMYGKHPKAVITDGDKSMRKAIQVVFPNTRHRLCAWHLHKNAGEHVKDKKFLEEFKSLMYSHYTPEKFESEWKRVVDRYNVSNNDWVKKTYELKRMWASSYMRDHFLCGVRTTSICEGVNSFIKKYVRHKNSIVDFLHNFERALKDYRHNELLSDFKSFYYHPVLTTALPGFELGASKIFTAKKFKVVKKAIENVAALSITERSENEDSVVFKVNVYRNKDVAFYVHLDKLHTKFLCDCRRFERRGLPCSHIICAMKYEDMDMFPESLICKRWTKTAKSDHISSVASQESTDEKMSIDYKEALEGIYSLCNKLNKGREGNGHGKHKAKKYGARDPLMVKFKGAPRRGASRPKRNCTHCRKPGHYIVNCPTLAGTGVIFEDEEVDASRAESDKESKSFSMSKGHDINDDIHSVAEPDGGQDVEKSTRVKRKRECDNVVFSTQDSINKRTTNTVTGNDDASVNPNIAISIDNNHMSRDVQKKKKKNHMSPDFGESSRRTRDVGNGVNYFTMHSGIPSNGGYYFPQFPPGGIPSSHPNTVLHAGTPSAPSYTSHYFPQFPPGGIPSSHPNTVLHAGTPSAPSYTPFMTTLEEVERSAKLRKL